MKDKAAARLAYYNGIRQAMLDHIGITEAGLRNLKDVKPSKIEKLVADIHKHHLKLLKRIEIQIEEETARDKSR